MGKYSNEILVQVMKSEELKYFKDGDGVLDINGKKYTYTELIKAIEDGTEDGIAFAEEMYRMILRFMTRFEGF